MGKLVSPGAPKLLVQAAIGVVSEPALVPAGAEGVLEAASDGSVLVLGLSERWRAEDAAASARLHLGAHSHPDAAGAGRDRSRLKAGKK